MKYDSEELARAEAFLRSIDRDGLANHLETAQRAAATYLKLAHDLGFRTLREEADALDAQTTERTAKLRALLEKATPGPWNVRPNDDAGQVRAGVRVLALTAGEQRMSDAALIVAMRNELPAILDALDALGERASLPVIATCGECGFVNDEPSMLGPSCRRGSNWTGPAGGMSQDEITSQVRLDAAPPAWCPLRKACAR